MLKFSLSSVTSTICHNIPKYIVFVKRNREKIRSCLLRDSRRTPAGTRIDPLPLGEGGVRAGLRPEMLEPRNFV